MAEMIDGWTVVDGYDLYNFGEEAESCAEDEPIAEDVSICFVRDDELVTIALVNGVFADRRILVGCDELLSALRLAEIIE